MPRMCNQLCNCIAQFHMKCNTGIFTLMSLYVILPWKELGMFSIRVRGGILKGNIALFRHLETPKLAYFPSNNWPNNIIFTAWQFSDAFMILTILALLHVMNYNMLWTYSYIMVCADLYTWIKDVRVIWILSWRNSKVIILILLFLCAYKVAFNLWSWLDEIL